MVEDDEKRSLVHGSNIISRALRVYLCPVGWMFKFDSNDQPKPLSIYVALMNIICVAGLIFIETFISRESSSMKTSVEKLAMKKSFFLEYLRRISFVYKVVYLILIGLIPLYQYATLANVIASNNKFVSEGEQKYLAKRSMTIFSIRAIVNCISYVSLALGRISNDKLALTDIFAFAHLLAVNTMITAILTYVCYLGAALGKHVENFSKLYVDSMFDQFMKAIDKGDNNDDENDDKIFDDNDEIDESQYTRRSWIWSCFWAMRVSFRGIRRFFWHIYMAIRRLYKLLNLRKYPELPEMQMTKLSFTTNIQMCELKRIGNNHLIRVRLRRTQCMLSDLRDSVGDINKVAAPVVLMFMIYITLVILFVSTANIHGKLYKSFDMLIIPSIGTSIDILISVLHTCTCLDETSKQLKLLINKLFDFIIMNHRVQSSSAKRASTAMARLQLSKNVGCIIPGSECGAIDETWSQFQYTRKLASTIQFSMGGVIPVTRRSVLSIYGHILSAVFVSIEIMNIVDTMDHDDHHTSVVPKYLNVI